MWVGKMENDKVGGSPRRTRKAKVGTPGNTCGSVLLGAWRAQERKAGWWWGAGRSPRTRNIILHLALAQNAAGRHKRFKLLFAPFWMLSY
jgi:hypothetical protein